MFQAKYESSRALIVGINDYAHASPLQNPCNDADAVARALIGTHGFPESNVTVLKNSEADKASIHEAFMAFTECEADERIVFYFAGHGHTVTGNRGEVGFLVPSDGDVNKIQTLIPWRELTSSSELIPAKHILFAMDACCGGLALHRKVSPGSVRFVHDMLRRRSRQVITAGKADETVADGGGPRAGHSVFTGHFLDALEGAAVHEGEVLTANSLMAYTYSKVSQDYESGQTPSYGFMDGDGDLVLDLEAVSMAARSDEVEQGVLVEVSPALGDQTIELRDERSTELMKQYLSEQRFRVQLDDFVTAQVRKCLSELAGDNFSLPVVSRTDTVEEFQRRLDAYNSVSDPMMTTVALLGRWAVGAQQDSLGTVFSRLPDANKAVQNTSGAWYGMSWYPIMRLQYTAGISAFHSGNFENMRRILLSNSIDHLDKTEPVISSTVEGMLMVTRAELFKTLPGFERYYAPMSEYMFTNVQPQLDDSLFLGHSYERLFDRFDAFYSLVYAELRYRNSPSVWGPIGRFGWKYRLDHGVDNPFKDLVTEAVIAGEDWPPLKAGFFQGSIDRFTEVAGKLGEDIANLKWI